MKDLLDCSSNEIFEFLQEVLVSQNFDKAYLRNVWMQSDCYSLAVQKYKENEISIHFMLKIQNRDLESFTVKNSKTTDELKMHVVKILKTLPTT
jgi:hypothetical protein